MFWWVTVPMPTCGSHIDADREAAGPDRGRGTAWCRRRPCPARSAAAGRTRAARAARSRARRRRQARAFPVRASRRATVGTVAVAHAAAPQRLGGEDLERAARGRAPREARRVLERVLGEQARGARRRADTRSMRTRQPGVGSSTSRPVRSSTIASVWPAMRVATAGVPHAAASVIVMPQPSCARRAREHPRPPVEVEQRRVVDATGQRDPLGRRRAPRPGARARRARSPRPRSPPAARAGAPSRSASASISTSKRFTGTSRPTATTSGVGRCAPARRERRIDAGRHHRDVRRPEVQLAHDLVLRRLRQRDDRRAAVQRRRDPELDRRGRAARGAAGASSPTSSRARGAATRHAAGARAQTGEKNGMPFQISTSASLAPCQPIISLNAARGNTR